MAREPDAPAWWKSAVVYQIWPRSFADGDGDGGYDVRDYQDIDPTFGTLEQFDELLAAVHTRGMKLIMDLRQPQLPVTSGVVLA